METSNLFVEYISIFKGIHQGSWFFLLLLFFLTYSLNRAIKGKTAKVSHMVLRLFYVLMLFSGIWLVIAYNFVAFYTVKGLIAVLMVGLMEISCVRAKKGKRSTPAFYIGSVLLIIVILMGYRVISF